MKTETAFAAMEKMGFQAATLGEKEFMHGFDFLRGRIRAHPNLFVSANVLDAATNKPLAQPFVIRTYPARGGKKPLRVGITGYLDAQHLPEVQALLKTDAAKVRLTDGIPAVGEIVKTLRPRVDVMVVLAHTGMQGAMDVAKEVPGINLVVLGHAVGIFWNEAPVVNGATIVSNGDRARFGAQAALSLATLATGPAQVRQLPLSINYPENAVMVALRDAYKERLAALSGGVITEKEMTPTAKFVPVSGGNRYIGNSACAPCHVEAATQWEKSPHAQALHTLQVTKNGIDAKRPDCLRCHTVGFAQPTGFRVDTPNEDLGGVGCETCHGPGELHTTRALAGMANPGAITSAVPAGNKALCVQCHDAINDPKFNFAEDLEKIRHWGPGFEKS